MREKGKLRKRERKSLLKFAVSYLTTFYELNALIAIVINRVVLLSTVSVKE